MFYEVIPTKIFRQDGGILTYRAPEKLISGQIVLVPLGKATVPGIVLREVKRPKFQTKDITKILYRQPLPQHLVQGLQWLSSYYLAPLPQVANMVLPVGIAKKRRRSKQATAASTKITQATSAASKKIKLNSAQKSALKTLVAHGPGTQLLHGVTGSGKTHIYLELAKKTFEQGQSTILLVPEIALTSQLVQIFERTFGAQVAVLHSRQTEAERHKMWQSILESKQPLVVIGPRSALFAPVRNLGLILIDEAHETTYFQDNAPKYSAVRLASAMAGVQKIPCILGTATPLVTDYFLAEQKNALVRLDKKAKTTARSPKIIIVDLKDQRNFVRNCYFSDILLKQIQQSLDQHQQTLIFHNRRGSAPMTLCKDCGWQAMCPNCFLPLTLHADTYTLRCHVCGHQEKVPSSCPDCHAAKVVHKGFGTKLLETELKRLFPKARIARFDADNAKGETLDHLYTEVKTGEIDILVGTQTLTKGLDLPKLATVGVVQADAGLSLPDYAADEHVFQLLTQVLGRIGRGHIENTRAIVQTYQPDNPIIQHALRADYNSFATHTLSKRRRQQLPPYNFLAKITVIYKTEAATVRQIRKLRTELSRQIRAHHWQIEMSPPMPAFHEHTPRGYIWQIVLKSKKRTELVQLLQQLPANSAIHLALDPPSML